MDAKELEQAIEKYLETLPDDEDIEWFCTDRAVGGTVLRAFLWKLFPELKPENLPSWEEWPLKLRR